MLKLDIKINTTIYDFKFSHDISNKHFITRALAEIIDTRSGEQIGEISPLENLHNESLSFAVKEFVDFFNYAKTNINLERQFKICAPYSTMGILKRL